MILFNDREISLLKTIEATNTDELVAWKLPNLNFPLYLVISSIICYGVFKVNASPLGAVNLLLNGSLAMFALNRMSSVGLNLLKYDKAGELKGNANTYTLRVKINEYSKWLTYTLLGIYIYQVTNTPFESGYMILFQILLGIISIYYAVTLSRYAFLLQDRFLERTLGDEIRDEMIDAKNHLDKKYS